MKRRKLSEAEQKRDETIAAQMGVSVRQLRRTMANLVSTCDTCGAQVKVIELRDTGCPVCKEADEHPQESVN